MASDDLARIYRDIKLSPRVRLAAVAYAAGTVTTKREAARLAGVTKEHFTHMTNHNEETRRIINDTSQMINDETIATSKILQMLSRKAIGRLADLMESPNDAIAFRAAQDLADRGPETQKTQRLQVESLTLTGEDAKQLAKAMVESADVSRRFAHVAVDGLTEVDTDKRDEHQGLRLIKAETTSGQEA